MSRLEWQIGAAGSEGAEGRQALAAAESSQQRVRAAQRSRRQQQPQQEEEEFCLLYEPPVWMVVAYALSTLPGVPALLRSCLPTPVPLRMLFN